MSKAVLISIQPKWCELDTLVKEMTEGGNDYNS